MAVSKTIATLITDIQFWLRLATFLHEPLKCFLLHILHNVGQDPSYNGLPQNQQQLYQELATKHRKQVTKLLNRKLIQKDQMDLLLPPMGLSTDSSQFDVTLICILIRNLTTLPAPLKGWNDKNPAVNDTSIAAFVIRAREWRNFLHHFEPKQITQIIFNQKWSEGEQIINNSGFTFNTTKLKTISLDPQHETVLKSLFQYLAQLEAKHDALTLQQISNTQDIQNITHHQTNLDLGQKSNDQKISDLGTQQDLNNEDIKAMTFQCTTIEQEVQHLKENIKENQSHSSESYCLDVVLEFISEQLSEEEIKKMLKSPYIINAESEEETKKFKKLLKASRTNWKNVLVCQLKKVAWCNIKKQLELIGRHQVVHHIQQKTLITQALHTASTKLRQHYMKELIKCLMQQPLRKSEEDTNYRNREDVYIDLVVLPSSVVDKEWTNSDRNALMEQPYLPTSTAHRAVDQIFLAGDELLCIRGVAGIGKSTLLEMFTLKWAKDELYTNAEFDFVFKFTCRELNSISSELSNLEDLFALKYPEIFDLIQLKDLMEISEKVLIIVDGLDELKDIYSIDRSSNHTMSNLNKIVFELINPKGDWLRNHRSIACGRPKACEFVKKQTPINSNRKTVEVCGFNEKNIKKYIQNFFGDKNKEKSDAVLKLIEQSYNLRIMAKVPIFLFTVCSVYQEGLINHEINTHTELYIFTTLVFLRNHMRDGKRELKQYENLMAVVEDKTVLNVLYALMELSVKTYMENQVVFSETDIQWLQCPFHLEETGFLVKYQTGNIKAATYQFRHLVLQEFFTALYLSVTKDISPFLTNRELSSCKTTIIGIQRMLKMKDNELFIELYQQLLTIHQSKLDSRAVNTNSIQDPEPFDKFVGSFLKIPPSMVEDEETLVIYTPSIICKEFLALYKESQGSVLPPPKLKSARITTLRSYKDYRNIVNLLMDLNITKIHKLEVDALSFSEEEKYLMLLTLGNDYKTWVTISAYLVGLECKPGRLQTGGVYFQNMLEDLILKSTAFIVEIEGTENEMKSDVKHFFQKVSPYKKPITLRWKFMRDGLWCFYDQQTVQAILESLDIDMKRNDIYMKECEENRSEEITESNESCVTEVEDLDDDELSIRKPKCNKCCKCDIM